MIQSLIDIRQCLVNLIAKVQEVLLDDQPFGLATDSWIFPCLTRQELILEAQSLIDFIDTHQLENIGDAQLYFKDYIPRINFLINRTVPNLLSNSPDGVFSYIFTLNGLRKHLESGLSYDAGNELLKIKKNNTRINSIEATLNSLEPKTESLNSMIEHIEHTYRITDQFPIDFESFSKYREKIEEIHSNSVIIENKIQGVLKDTSNKSEELNQIINSANSILKRCEKAYSASTSVGLAAAFSERSKELNTTILLWSLGLVAALFIGSYYGSDQLHNFNKLILNPDASIQVLLINLFLSLLSIGAPVWFSWLATKQIGQRFRLAEDYAYKASISRAYEGYRLEASRFNKELEERLLVSALTRLDENPLRLVETQTHGSPWHELASSDVVKQAIKLVPGFTEQIKQVAIEALKSTKNFNNFPSNNKAHKNEE